MEVDTAGESSIKRRAYEDGGPDRTLMRKLHAALIALALTGWAYIAAVWVVGDAAFRSTAAVPPGRELRAAVAIRDDVTPFQKWGSEMFTRRYLSRYYDAAWYFTQAHKGDLREEFVSCLNNALERYPHVDLFLLAHKNEYIKWVEQLPAERRQRLRFVYNTGCHNQPQGPRWLELGARAYVGHPGTTWSPIFYFFFLRRWTRGSTVQQATDASNVLMERTLKQWERVSLGHWNAASLMCESAASCYGHPQLRLEDVRE